MDIRDKVVYQIYPKSFYDTNGDGLGDLAGVTAKLDYLKELGVDFLWLTPFFVSPQNDNGYDVADYCAVDPRFGTMEDVDALIRAARARGIGIMLDMVFNHTSTEHAWFRRALTGDPAYMDYYIFKDGTPDAPPTNWISKFGGNAWEYVPALSKYYLHLFDVTQADLNWENPEVRDALYRAANFWLNKGVGGFRIDAITYIKKPAVFTDGMPDAADGMVSVHTMTVNTPGILDFLHEFRREVFDGHDIFTVGEANGVSPAELPDWVGENGVFSMLFEFAHVLVPYESGETWCKMQPWKLTKLKAALSASQAGVAREGWCPIYFENHDRARSVNYFLPKDADPVLGAKALATVLLTLRGTPFIYEGEELGMTNVAWDSISDYDDISSHGQYELARAEGYPPTEALSFVHFNSRDNARTPMQWDDTAHAGFTTGTPWLPVNENYPAVNAAAEEKDANSVLAYYKKLIRLRTEHPLLLRGKYEELLKDSEQIYAFARTEGNRRTVTAVNFTTEQAALPAELLRGTRLIGNYADAPLYALRPLEAIVYEEEIG